MKQLRQLKSEKAKNQIQILRQMAQAESTRDKNFGHQENQPSREAARGDGSLKRQNQAYLTAEQRVGQGLGKNSEQFSGEGVIVENQDFKYRSAAERSPIGNTIEREKNY